MKKEVKVEEKVDQQHVLDSTIKENWLARVGVHKPYTIFVCIMAILILGVFALTTLKMELFPKMNLPYAVVVLSPDQDALVSKHMSPAALYDDLKDDYPILVTATSNKGSALTQQEILSAIIGLEHVTELQDLDMGTISEANRRIFTANLDAFARTALASTTPNWGTMTTDAQEAAITMMVNGMKAIDLTNTAVVIAAKAQIRPVFELYWMTEFTSAYVSDKLAELAPANVTAKLATAMASSLEQVSGKKTIQSTSMNGVAIIFMEYQSGVTVDQTALLLAVENSNLLDKPDVYGIKYTKMIMKLDPSMMPAYSFTVSGKTKDWYQKTLIPRLRATVGVADISSKFDSQTSTNQSWVGKGDAEFPETVSFTIQKSTDVSTTETVKNIIKTLDDLGLEKDKDYLEVMNQGAYITGTILSVAENLIIGMLLAVIILFLFLRSVKMTLAIAISIPVSLIATFVIMFFMGIGLNIVSMSALALAMGMLVDNSVVVLENIFRLRQKGASIRECAIRGASQVMGAMVAATLTTICVFFPMFFLTGLIMEVFMDLVWVIICSLACSLLVAIMFLPGIISSFKIDAKPKKERTKERSKFAQFFVNSWAWTKMAYDRALNFSITRKWATVGIAMLLFVGSAALLFINGFILMPSTDNGEFTATVNIIPSENQNVNKEDLAKDIYTIVRQTLPDDLKTCMVEYSNGGGIMSVMRGGSNGGMSISIALKEKRSISTEKAAQKIANALENLPSADYTGVANVKGIYQGKLGEKVAYSSSSMTGGMVADSVTVTLASLDTANPESANNNLGSLNSKVLAALDKTKVEGVYSTESSWSSMTITQVDKRVVVTYTMKIVEGAKISDVQSRVDKVVADMLKNDNDFKNIETHNDGFAEQMKETYTSLIIAIAVGLVLVYLVMVMVFQSFIMPLIVLICIPLAFTGAFIGLAICGMPLSVPALIGFLVLMGVITNNGILAVDYTNQARRDGLNIRDALVAAMHIRMRPIFMTALTTVVGLLPMALGLSIFSTSTMGGSMMQPLAIVTIGGLLVGTMTTLLVVPAFYAIFVRDDSVRGKKKVAVAAVTDGGASDTNKEAEKDEFVRVRGKKVNKAKKADKEHIIEGELLGAKQ